MKSTDEAIVEIAGTLRKLDGTSKSMEEMTNILRDVLANAFGLWMIDYVKQPGAKISDIVLGVASNTATMHIMASKMLSMGDASLNARISSILIEGLMEAVLAVQNERNG